MAREGGGKSCAAIQLHRTEHGVEVSLITEQPDAALRKTGSVLGVDFGFAAALFATNQGQLLGSAMLVRLRELDAVLESVTADLQRRGVSLKTDPTYRKLQARIRDYVANEIGRLLNRLAADEVGELVVERLDFRGGGLSKRMNRLCTRAGRRVLKARLAATDRTPWDRRHRCPRTVFQPAVLGMRLRAQDEPQEPSTLRVRVLRQKTSRGRERVQEPSRRDVLDHYRTALVHARGRTPADCSTATIANGGTCRHQARSTALQVPVDAAARLRDLKPMECYGIRDCSGSFPAVSPRSQIGSTMPGRDLSQLPGPAMNPAVA